MAQIFLVRHAQAQLNADNYDQLSELGIVQADFLGLHWQQLGLTFDQIFCGTLQRQQHTLERIKQSINCTIQEQIIPELDEYNFKLLIKSFIQATDKSINFANLSGKDKFRLLRAALNAWVTHQLSQTAMPAFSQFALKVAQAREQICQQAQANQNILVVSSGGVISVWLQTLLGLTPAQAMALNLQIRNTAISEFYCDKGNMQLVSFNHIAHLENPQRLSALTYS